MSLGSWIAGVSNVDQWIEVELETIYRIFAIATKGYYYHS